MDDEEADKKIDLAYMRVRDVEILEDPERAYELPMARCPRNMRMILRMALELQKMETE